MSSDACWVNAACLHGGVPLAEDSNDGSVKLGVVSEDGGVVEWTPACLAFQNRSQHLGFAPLCSLRALGRYVCQDVTSDEIKEAVPAQMRQVFHYRCRQGQHLQSNPTALA